MSIVEAVIVCLHSVFTRVAYAYFWCTCLFSVVIPVLFDHNNFFPIHLLIILLSMTFDAHCPSSGNLRMGEYICWNSRWESVFASSVDPATNWRREYAFLPLWLGGNKHASKKTNLFFLCRKRMLTFCGDHRLLRRTAWSAQPVIFMLSIPELILTRRRTW